MSVRRILGLGTIVVDHQFVIEEFPVPDTKVETLTARWQIGGPVPTALVLLSRWGHECHFAGFWGNDPHGDMIEEDLEREHVLPLSGTQRNEFETGVAHVWVEAQTGRRTIVCHRVNLDTTAGEQWKKDLPETDVLHLDGWPPDLAIHLATTVRQRGGLVALDTGSPKGQTETLLECVDVVNAPRRFLNQFLGHDDPEQGAQQLREFGPRIVTVTDGANGAWISSGKELFYQAAYPVEALDTTGAGDVFSAALIHGVLQDWPLSELLKFASATAALKSTQIGNRAALPTLSQVQEFLSGLTPKKPNPR